MRADSHQTVSLFGWWNTWWSPTVRFQVLGEDRFVRIVRLTIENDGGVNAGVFQMGLPIARFELVLRPEDASSSEVLRVRCVGVRDLVVENVTGGAVCRLQVSYIEARGWEGIRYSVEVEDSLKLYCQDLTIDVIRDA